ncbi:MAG: hypothetical protein R2758_05895 [Bacteroidales bacterium]
MVIASIYGAHSVTGIISAGVLYSQNLLNINLGAGAFVTGSGANLLAAALIGAPSEESWFSSVTG